MARRVGILGTQQAPGAGILTDAYTVPLAKYATAKVLICNRTGSADTFRVALSPAGAAIDSAHYVAYDQDLAAHDAVASVGFTIGETDVVRVRSAAGACSFTVTGIEDDA